MPFLIFESTKGNIRYAPNAKAVCKAGRVVWTHPRRDGRDEVVFRTSQTNAFPMLRVDCVDHSTRSLFLLYGSPIACAAALPRLTSLTVAQPLAVGKLALGSASRFSPVLYRCPRKF